MSASKYALHSYPVLIAILGATSLCNSKNQTVSSRHMVLADLARHEYWSILITAVIAIAGFIRTPRPRTASLFKVTPELKTRQPWIIAIAIFVLGKALSTFLLGTPDDPAVPDLSDFAKLRTSIGFAVGTTLLLALVIPLFEELLVRGYAFSFFLSFNRRWVAFLGAVCLSTLFALGHEDPMNHLSSGLAYSWLRYSQKTLLGSLAIHVIWNTLLMLILVLGLQLFNS